jgi:hypothetical protein
MVTPLGNVSVRAMPLSATVLPPAVATTVPLGHVVAAFGVAAIVTPVGKVSVRAIPVSATAPEAVFGIVIVNVEVPPEAIDVGENAFAIESDAGVIVRFAVAGAPFDTVCVSFSAAVGIVLVYVFATVPVTLTVIVHDDDAASVPPLSATLPPPATATTVPLGQVVAAFGVAAIVTPVGNASVNAMPVSATAPEAVFGIVMVRVEVPPEAIDVGKNALAIASAAGVIVRLADVDDSFVTAWLSISALAGIVFVYVFATVPVTLTDIVQLLAAPIVALVSTSVDPPAVALAVPEAQVVAALGVAAIVTPVGSVSVRPAPVSATAPVAVFAMVTVNVEVAPEAIDVGENALESVTGGATSRVALAGELLVAPCVVVNELVGIVFV